MPTFALTIDLPEARQEELEARLHDEGAAGLEIRDRETRPMPGVRAPGVGEVIVVAYFGERPVADQVAQAVRHDFPAARTQVDAVPDTDWSESWKSLIRSVQVGRLWVGPPWEEPPPGKVAVTIEPKMAFGTGDHPTTSLCLAAVDAYLAEHPGASVLDVGTGTAVLAIAAKKLGASRVVGTDNDPVSVELAEENARRNQAEGLELSGAPVEQVSGTFDLVLANILANTLVALAPAVTAKVADRLVLAGVLAHQREEVEAAYVRAGLFPAHVERSGEWVRIDLRRGSRG